MISTRNLTGLPDPPSLKQLTKSLAMLDALIQREWEYRYYSFDSKWADYGEMASMRKGGTTAPDWEPAFVSYSTTTVSELTVADQNSPS